MFACVCIGVYLCITYTYIYIHTCIYIYIYLFICLFIYLYIYLYTTDARTHIRARVYVHQIPMCVRVLCHYHYVTLSRLCLHRRAYKSTEYYSFVLYTRILLEKKKQKTKQKEKKKGKLNKLETYRRHYAFVLHASVTVCYKKKPFSCNTKRSFVM